MPTKQTTIINLKHVDAIVYQEDLERIGEGWYSNAKGYVCRTVKRSDGTWTTETMQQAIIGKAPKGMSIDHINRKPYDNRSDNLRFATPREQLFNRNGWSSTGIKGVRKHTNGGFTAHIGDSHAKGSYLGCYRDITKAFAARKQAEIELGMLV